MTGVAVPEDFPWEPWPALLAGAQPKFAGRLIDGKFIVGLTAEERAERYLMCQDLVDQLVSYCQRKASEHPDSTRDALLAGVEKGIRGKQVEWGLGWPEVDWIVGRVRAGFRE